MYIDFKKNCFYVLVLAILLGFFLVSCDKKNEVVSLSQDSLFALEYGNFENEVNLFSLSQPSDVHTYITMQDGFFYIVNGESKKILELSSYGDLISIYYNEGTNPTPEFAEDDFAQVASSTKKAVSYPFNSLGPITVDSHKYIYVVDTLPEARQEMDTENRLLLSQVVLRFSNNGEFIDYIGQRGPGGEPFPYIRSLYTTQNNELVVVCQTNTGMIVYWYDDTGYLRHSVPFDSSQLPNPLAEQTPMEMFVMLDKVIPSRTEDKLYVKIDYYTSTVDTASNVQSGIDYTSSLLFPLDVNTGNYEKPLTIPVYQQEDTDGLTRVVYPLPYEFLGVTESGWFFFIVPDATGYHIQMIQKDGLRILNRHLELNHKDVLYHNFSLSSEGMISVLLAYTDNVTVSWWRTDSLIDSILKE